MELANNIRSACFTMFRIIIIRVCVNVIVMTRFINIICFKDYDKIRVKTD